MSNVRRVSALVTGTVVTMDQDRSIIADGAVAVHEGAIVDVGPRTSVEAAVAPEQRFGGHGALIIPGLVNAHQHLTGDRLIRSAIPDKAPAHSAIFDWAVPIHAAHQAEDDELTATLALAESALNGITTTIEAGTVAHPERVIAAFERVGCRGTVGTWGWDVDDAPFAAPWQQVIDRQRATLEAAESSTLVDGWVTLVGHDLMSDELIGAASDLARSSGTGLTFHMSPGPGDTEAYLERTGRSPLEHLDDLGVLGDHVLIGHGVHLSDEETNLVLTTRTALAYCPWAYLRLGQGVTRAGRHINIALGGGRIALGCDTENAGDRVDVLGAARLAAGLARDREEETSRFGAHEAFELATISGAQAIGLGDRIGSLERGKRADIVVVDRSGIGWEPISDDPVLQLVWGAPPGSVRDVLVDGEPVVRDRQLIGVDIGALLELARDRRAHLIARSGLDPVSFWPVV